MEVTVHWPQLVFLALIALAIVWVGSSKEDYFGLIAIIRFLIAAIALLLFGGIFIW